MSFEAKYDLEDKDIRTLELISQIDGHLQVLKMNPDWANLLEAKARIKEAVGSIGIEGTILTLDQANAITTGDSDVKVGEKEKREFIAYFESLEFIKSNLDVELGLGQLLKLHEMITRGDAGANPGKLRTDSRSVQKESKIVYTAPPYDQISFLLRDFFIWFNRVASDKNLSPVVCGAICHFWFVWIHPFADGNGRTARLLTTHLLLKKKSEGVKYFALSGYYNQHLGEYDKALKDTNICDPNVPSMNFGSPLTPWMRFFISSYYSQMEATKEVTNRILQLNIRIAHLRKDGLISDRHERILSFLSGREKASYKELQGLLGDVTAARVTQLLEPLRDAKILAEERIGKNIWFKLGAPENEPNEDALKKKLNYKMPEKRNKIPAKQGVLPIFFD